MQFGFQHDRRHYSSLTQHYKKEILFQDFKKVFDSLSHNDEWITIASLGVSSS